MSLDRLTEKIVQTQNPTVVGLDPKLEYVPAFIKEKYFRKYGNTLKAAAKALFAFNKGLIDQLYDIVPAVKPQCAYYEMYGWQGVKTLAKTMEYAREKGMFVITDGKRNVIHHERAIRQQLFRLFNSDLSKLLNEIRSDVLFEYRADIARSAMKKTCEIIQTDLFGVVIFNIFQRFGGNITLNARVFLDDRIANIDNIGFETVDVRQTVIYHACQSQLIDLKSDL